MREGQVGPLNLNTDQIIFQGKNSQINFGFAATWLTGYEALRAHRQVVFLDKPKSQRKAEEKKIVDKISQKKTFFVMCGAVVGWSGERPFYVVHMGHIKKLKITITKFPHVSGLLVLPNLF